MENKIVLNAKNILGKILVAKELSSNLTDSEINNIITDIKYIISLAEEEGLKEPEQSSNTEHNKWQVIRDLVDGSISGYKCTKCNEYYNSPTNYCPNCGTIKIGLLYRTKNN